MVTPQRLRHHLLEVLQLVGDAALAVRVLHLGVLREQRPCYRRGCERQAGTLKALVEQRGFTDAFARISRAGFHGTRHDRPAAERELLWLGHI